jgi:hypothetical protein
MADTATLSGSMARAAGAGAAYRRILGINLGLNVVIGLLTLLFPTWFADVIGARGAVAPWLPAWGLALLFLTLLYVPGWMRPATIRMPNLIGLAERLVMGIAFLILGVPLLGLYALAFCAALTWGYYRLFVAELATRP